MILIILLSCIIAFFVWFFYTTYIWPYYVSPLRKIPGPPSESLLYGNLGTIYSEESGDAHLKWLEKYGDIVKYHGILNKPIILVADKTIIQQITTTKAYDFVKPPTMLAGILGNGLVTAQGEDHKVQRKMMQPAFMHTSIKNMFPKILRITLTLKRLLEGKVNLVDESKIILTPFISKATLDIIGLVGFDYEFHSLTEPNELANAYGCIMGFTSAVYMVITVLSSYVPLIRKIPIHTNRMYNNSVEVIERETRRLIREKYEEDKVGKLNGEDLISLLINTNKTLPDEDKLADDVMKYQIMTFLMAGHETSSNAVSWILYLLSRHPREQDLLREELVKAFPDKSEYNPTFDEINSLEYLNCVVKESLRLISPVSSVTRVSLEDITFGHYNIPKDTQFAIPIGPLSRLPSVWGSTTEDFDPKRWLDPFATKNVTNFNYMPFYAGARSCIGYKLANNEIKTLVGMLIRNFIFRPVEGSNIRRRSFLVAKPDPFLELNVSKVEA